MVTRQEITGKGRASEGGSEMGDTTSTSSQLPYAVDVQMSLSPAELQVLQNQFIEEQDKGYVSTQTKFNLAW